MVKASALRKAGDPFRGKPHGVSMPLAPLDGVISETTGRAMFRAQDAETDVREADLDLPLFKPEVDSFNPPRFIDPEQLGIMCRKCFHPGNLRHRPPRNDREVPLKYRKTHLFLVAHLEISYGNRRQLYPNRVRDYLAGGPNFSAAAVSVASDNRTTRNPSSSLRGVGA